ncbi:RHS repeat-associated core domain-containing protein [Alteromonas sp. 5E99-2]|nr:RHS repeat-associated core domain-containing protein [Alteromonas sp. 5E99-2]
MATRRGFTDHEHLDEVELIHMNGRVYDYNVGRFMSVDPIVQDIGNSQGINPYSYVMNNPLRYTDPSGYTADPKRSDSICGNGDSCGSAFNFSGSPGMNAGGNGTGASNEVKPNTNTQVSVFVAQSSSGGAEGSGGDTTEIGSLQSTKLNGEAEAVFGVENGVSVGGILVSNSQILDWNARHLAATSKLDTLRAGSYFKGVTSLIAEQQSVIDAINYEIAVATDTAGLTSSTPIFNLLGVGGLARSIVSRTVVAKGLTRTPNEAGVVREFVTESDQVFFRVFSDRPQGSFLTAVPPRSSAFAQEALALPRNNTASLIQEVLVPAGTRVRRSRASPLRADDVFPNRRGGAEQFELLRRIPNSSFGPGSPLQ